MVFDEALRSPDDEEHTDVHDNSDGYPTGNVHAFLNLLVG